MLCKDKFLLDTHMSGAKAAAACKPEEQAGSGLAVRGPEGAHQRPSTTDLWNASCPALSYGWSQTLSSSQPTPPLGLAPPLVSRAGANGLPQSKSLKFDHSNSDTAAARAVLLSELQKEN